MPALTTTTECNNPWRVAICRGFHVTSPYVVKVYRDFVNYYYLLYFTRRDKINYTQRGGDGVSRTSLVLLLLLLLFLGAIIRWLMYTYIYVYYYYASVRVFGQPIGRVFFFLLFRGRIYYGPKFLSTHSYFSFLWPP